MPLDPVKNFAIVTLLAGYAAGVTTVVLSSGHGAKLPDPAADGAFNLVWWNSSDYVNPSDDPLVEIVRCTARSTDTLTITRAQETTSDANHNISGKTYKMLLSITKKMIDDINTHVIATNNPHSVTQTQVGLANVTNDAQLKRTSGDFNSFTAKSAIVDADIFLIEDSEASYAKKKVLKSVAVTASYRGCVVRQTSAQTIANNTVTPINFDTEDIDTNGIHEGVTNPSRLTVPAGVTRVRLNGWGVFASNATGMRRWAINKNGAGFVQGPCLLIQAADDDYGRILSSTPCLVVVAGDYFELAAYQNSGGNLDTYISATYGCWFEMEIIA